MKKGILFVSILLFILQLSGCAPSKSIEEARVMSADRLIKKLEANRRKIKTFTGQGTLSINSSTMNAKSSFEVIVKKPDSLKASFYGPFGIDLAQVLITQKDFMFYDIINNILYRGKMRNDVMKQLLKIDLPFDEVINALTGSVNLTDKLRIEPDKYENSEGMYKLTYIDSVNAVDNIYFVRNSDLAITQFLLSGKGNKKLLEESFSDFNNVADVPVPYRTIVQDSKNNQWMKVEYKKVEANEPVEDFDLDVPNDAQVIEW